VVARKLYSHQQAGEDNESERKDAMEAARIQSRPGVEEANDLSSFVGFSA
jgi:hypothetical protein